MSTTNITSGGLATLSINANGNVIPDEMEILSVEIKKSVNKIPTAKVVIIDGKPSTGKFEASSSNTFLPGTSIKIEAGYDANIIMGIGEDESLEDGIAVMTHIRRLSFYNLGLVTSPQRMPSVHLTSKYDV